MQDDQGSITTGELNKHLALSAAAVLLGAAGLFGVAHAETAPGHPAVSAA